MPNSLGGPQPNEHHGLGRGRTHGTRQDQGPFDSPRHAIICGTVCCLNPLIQLHVVLWWATHRTSSHRRTSHQRLGHQPALFGVLLSCCVLLRRYIHSIFRCMSYRRHPASTVGISMPALDFRPLPLRRKRLGGRPAGCDTFLDFMAAAGEGSA